MTKRLATVWFLLGATFSLGDLHKAQAEESREAKTTAPKGTAPNGTVPKGSSRKSSEPKVIDFNAPGPQKENQVCVDVRKLIMKKVRAGASQKEIAKDVEDLLPAVQVGSNGNSCRNIRLAFHLMRQPAQGKVILMKDWQSAIELLNKAN